MPEMEAAIGCVQLGKLPEFVAKRTQNAGNLSEKLRKAKDLQLPEEPEGYKHGWYLYTVRMKNANRERRDRVVETLRQNGIGALVCYVNPIHLMPFYGKFGKYKLPVTEKASEQVLSLPVHPGVNRKQIGFIAEIFLRSLS
jgi:dTDP-4-amino-4,6-dideoxygalactose transaminase